MMNNEITSTSDLSEQFEEEMDSDIVATREPEDKGIEFHVSMRSYTQRDMELLIVEAAARVLVGERGNNKLAKAIEERCIALTTEKVEKHLTTVVAEIIDQPLTPKYEFAKDEKPVTMREFIGLTGQAFLTAYVDRDGKPTSDRYYGKPRLQHIIDSIMSKKFENEIKIATNAMILEMQKQVKAGHDKLLAEERARLRKALEALA